jgi:hypothetical protein
VLGGRRKIFGAKWIFFGARKISFRAKKISFRAKNFLLPAVLYKEGAKASVGSSDGIFFAFPAI